MSSALATQDTAPATLSAPPPATSDDDRAIVARILAGERELFAVLMRRYNARIYRTVRAILKNDADCEDCMQQAYLSAFTHLRQYGGVAPFGAWLTRIAAHEALARVRHKPGEVPGFEPEPALDPEAHARGAELAENVEAALDAMPEAYRLVFVLREVQGLSTEEVADSLDLTPGAAKVRLHRAKNMLRADLTVRLGDAYAFHLVRCARVIDAVMRALPL